MKIDATLAGVLILFNHQTNYKTIYKSQDKRRLEEILESLWHCKNDQQQRSWPIYEDEIIINEYLVEVNLILVSV